jgi:hypothetical protein
VITREVEELTMRKSHPGEEMLADYLEGRLSDDDRAEMEGHLSTCESCLDELIADRDLLRNREGVDLEEVPSRVTEAAVHLVTERGSRSYVFPSAGLKRALRGFLTRLRLPVFGEWALSPIRGTKTVVSKDLIYLKKTFKEMAAEIQIEKMGDDKAHIRVSLVDHDQITGIRVTLKRGEREISSYPLGAGYVLFEDVPFGHYGLLFTRDGEVLGKYHFEIKGSNDGK